MVNEIAVEHAFFECLFTWSISVTSEIDKSFMRETTWRLIAHKNLWQISAKFYLFEHFSKENRSEIYSETETI